MIDYHTLKFWELAHQFTLDIYRVTRLSFPEDERFGLTSQIRRAAISIGSNIAEGCGRDTPREMRRFLNIAAGSCSEAEYQLELARDLEFLREVEANSLINTVIQVRRMIYNYARTLQTDT